MKVILNDHIEHLGERGDTVRVKPGYARNYLIPKRLAYPDTPGNRRLFEQEQRHWEDMDLNRRSEAEKAAAALTGTELTFERRAGENDVLFGSVSLIDIARELSDRGFEIDKRKVLLSEPIKSLGSVEIVVQIHRDIQVTLPIHVVRPGEQPHQADDEGAEPAEPPETAAAEAAATE
jgi:large subunit ribosomal protein L9